MLSIYEVPHEDNGVVIGAMLLCLEDGQTLQAKDFSKIIRKLNELDAKKGASIFLNPDLIAEETESYILNKICKTNKYKTSFILTDRNKAENYCGHFVDDNLRTAVCSVVNVAKNEIAKSKE